MENLECKHCKSKEIKMIDHESLAIASFAEIDDGAPPMDTGIEAEYMCRICGHRGQLYGSIKYQVTT